MKIKSSENKIKKENLREKCVNRHFKNQHLNKVVLENEWEVLDESGVVKVKRKIRPKT